MLHFVNKWPCKEATDQNTAWFGICHTDGAVEVAAHFHHRLMYYMSTASSIYLFKVENGVNEAELWFGFFSKQVNIERVISYRRLIVTALETQ